MHTRSLAQSIFHSQKVMVFVSPVFLKAEMGMQKMSIRVGALSLMI